MDASLSLTLQYAVIAIAVLVSAWVVFRKQAPNAARRLRIAIALPLVREARPAWMRALGKWIAPPSKAADGCGGCSGCDDGSNKRSP
ncbi:DUF6587 family protein [Lysobacter brunescens]|uniref:DUF6587 family protein n=1 Tax=Lysobacter brunescens TaxID=262323 RepID=A0ABW2YH66_9GAMM